jgi:3-phenylpropionate/trans-cinnamate dioxygenase ferredoxin reductase subunit
MTVNVWDSLEELRALISSGHPVDRDRLADPAVELNAVTRSR